MPSNSLLIADVWAGHPVGFDLHTHNGRQYVAYYNASRQMTLAQRELNESTWTYHTLPTSVGWDSHNYIELGFDRDGHLHVSGNMHNVPLIYFRSTVPGDIQSMQAVHYMTGSAENQVTYPRFLNDHEGRLLFMYRNGVSGNGRRYINRYDEAEKAWSPLFEGAFLDGTVAGSNAYPRDIVQGPDGWFHLVWMWRKTSNANTNYHLSYARSLNLTEWETVDGQSLTLPITPNDTGTIVDPAPQGAGLINIDFDVSFDASDRPIINYHKYYPDSAGASHLYVARWTGIAWQRVRVSPDTWTHRWNLSRTGSLPIDLSSEPVEIAPDGNLLFTWQHVEEGSGTWALDPDTLENLGSVEGLLPYPNALDQATHALADFPEMTVQWKKNRGETAAGTRHFIRWETLPHNQDNSRPQPWPEASPLVVYALDAEGYVGGEPHSDTQVILDTDFRSDCDDAGTLGMLHALADLGECEILGVVASTTGPHVVGAIDAMNTFYGRPDIPVGLVEGSHPYGNTDSYAPSLASSFSSDQTNASAPTSSALYRQLLFAAPDDSVVIVVVGGQTALAQLLQTQADHNGDGIPFSGEELVAQKVRQLAVMGGSFTDANRQEFNIRIDSTAAQSVSQNWPTPILYSGFEIGREIFTGEALNRFDYATHPLAMAYYLYPNTVGGANYIGDRHSWDQATLHLAVRGIDDNGNAMWGLSEPGTVSFLNDGRTRFSADADDQHRYVTGIVDRPAIEAIIEGLMIREPGNGNVLPTITLSTPAEGVVFIDPASITISAEATDNDGSIVLVEFFADGDRIGETASAPYAISWSDMTTGVYALTARATDDQGATTVSEGVTITVLGPDALEPGNQPDAMVNLALLPSAALSGSVAEGTGKGSPDHILWDPATGAYAVLADYNEYGVAHQQNMGKLSDADPYFWMVRWPQAKYINYISLGGTYPNQPQPNTMWKVQYRLGGDWIDLAAGQGGWLDSGIFEWGGEDQAPIIAEALRVIAYSDGSNDVVSIHLRGRGGVSNRMNDSSTTPKATLIQYVGNGLTGLSLSSWRGFHFADPENTGEGEDDFDPMGDRIPNLVKYALGMHPLQDTVGHANLPRHSIFEDIVESARFLTLEYQTPMPPPPNASIVVETSTNLREWFPNAVQLEAVEIEPGIGYYRWRFPHPLDGETSQFMRLSVTVP